MFYPQQVEEISQPYTGTMSYNAENLQKSWHLTSHRNKWFWLSTHRTPSIAFIRAIWTPQLGHFRFVWWFHSIRRWFGDGTASGFCNFTCLICTQLVQIGSHAIFVAAVSTSTQFANTSLWWFNQSIKERRKYAWKLTFNVFWKTVEKSRSWYTIWSNCMSKCLSELKWHWKFCYWSMRKFHWPMTNGSVAL